MRIQMTMTDLDEEQWAYLQANVHAEYKIPEGASRVCLTFSHGEQERHVEMPMISATQLMMGLWVLNQTRRQADPSLPLLPTPDMVRDLSAKQAVDLTKLINTPCEHDSPAVSFEPSQFDDAPPVRTHFDGCRSYGPYAKPEPDA